MGVVLLCHAVCLVRQPEHLQSRWAGVPVPLSRNEILMSCRFLYGAGGCTTHRQMRPERVPQYMHADVSQPRPARRPRNEQLAFSGDDGPAALPPWGSSVQSSA